MQLRRSGFLLIDGAQPAPSDPVRGPVPAETIAASRGVGPLPFDRELAAAAD
jgi:hypothetical protein